MVGTWRDGDWTNNGAGNGNRLVLTPSNNALTGTFQFIGQGVCTAELPVTGNYLGSNFFDLYVNASGCDWTFPNNPPLPIGTLNFYGTLSGSGCRIASMTWLDSNNLSGAVSFGYFPTGETTTKANGVEFTPVYKPNPPNNGIGYLFEAKPTLTTTGTGGHNFRDNFVKELRNTDEPFTPANDTCFTIVPHDENPPVMDDNLFGQAFNAFWRVNGNDKLQAWNTVTNQYRNPTVISDIVGLPKEWTKFYRQGMQGSAFSSCKITAYQRMYMRTDGVTTIYRSYKDNAITFEIKRDSLQLTFKRDAASGPIEDTTGVVVWPNLDPPTNLVASVTSNSAIQLTWAKPDQGDKTGFRLSKKVGAGSWSTVPTLSWSSVCIGSSCVYTGTHVQGLATGTEYCFKLQSADDYTNLDPENTFAEDYGDNFSNTHCGTPSYPAPGQMSFDTSSIFQGDAFTATVQNGANMTIDVEYYHNNNGPYYVPSWQSLSGGSAYVWDTLYSPAGDWVITQIRNHACSSGSCPGDGWVDIGDVPLTVYPSPNFFAFDVSSVSKAVNGCFTFIMGSNAANMLVDVSVVMPDQSHWDSEQYGWPQLDGNGQATSCVSSASMEGLYHFYLNKNHASPTWLGIYANMTVTP